VAVKDISLKKRFTYIGFQSLARSGEKFKELLYTGNQGIQRNQKVKQGIRKGRRPKVITRENFLFGPG
jgi:hypothetical protein